MGLLMSRFSNSSSHHGGNDEVQTSRASSSSPISFPSGQQYEVFLSFRGETRHGFTDHLYKRLDNAKVSVFRDKEELPVGERNWPKIVRAIETSKISIPIISPNYASSEWCLNELIQILRCKKMFSQLVIPIFYRVTPSNVRKMLDVPEEESQPRKKRRHYFDGTHVQEWKNSLMEVSYMTGLESEKIADGYEGELVEIVVAKVLKALRKLTLVVSDDLVGVDHHVEEIMNRVYVEGSNDVHAILIHGMGGIGKTTLAKVLYNHLTNLFDCCSFLANIRETWSHHKGNIDLLDRLISDILGQKQSISSVDEGVNIATERFKHKKVLLLLDDVDHRDQLNALAGKWDWFARGSMLIVTSRMKNVLKEWESSFSYELNGLNKDQSFELFCKHAFKGSHSIPNEFHTIAKEIVSTTNGLPLAIEVIGCLLYREDQHIWKENLKKLKEIPHDEVQNKLKISFDALKYEERQIFLDIACLPISCVTEGGSAFHMWNSCRFYPTLGIEKLISMSLIKIGMCETLIVHDQLRDLGKEIIRQESINNLGKRSRLWKEEEAHEVLKSKQGTEKVETLCLSNYLRWRHYTSEQFEGMTELRYLEMDQVDLRGDFKNLFQNLRWLRWSFGELDFTESNFIPEKLVVLQLCQVNITEKWMGWSQMKHLKVLCLTACKSLTTIPDLSALEELEVLQVYCFYNLIEIHPSISNLKRLIEIELTRTGVTQLPDSIGDLCNLKSLRVTYTPIRCLPTSIRMLSKLQVLDLRDCRELESLPCLPCSLTSLKFYGNLMETLPDFPNLTNLELLLFKDDFRRWNRALDFRYLNQMRTLRIRYSTVEFRSSDSEINPLGKLGRVGLKRRWPDEGFEVSKNIYSLLELVSNLVELRLEGCRTLQTLNFSNFRNLSLLDISLCPELLKIDGLYGAEKLKDLKIYDCRNLVEINGLDKAESIQNMSIILCRSLERIGDLSHLKMLTTLKLCHCNKLSGIQGLENLPSLNVPHIGGCPALQDLLNLPKDVRENEESESDSAHF